MFHRDQRLDPLVLVLGFLFVEVASVCPFTVDFSNLNSHVKDARWINYETFFFFFLIPYFNELRLLSLIKLVSMILLFHFLVPDL